MSDLSCNADVTDSFNITQNTPISNSNCTLLNDVIVENHNDCDPCTQGPSVKKPRLFEQQDTVCKLNNGFKDGYNICNLKSLPEIQEELKKVRLCFDSKLKLALKEKLSKYISFIETTEKTVTSLKEEITQLTGRMDFIESSSKDLTKLINERVSDILNYFMLLLKHTDRQCYEVIDRLIFCVSRDSSGRFLCLLQQVVLVNRELFLLKLLVYLYYLILLRYPRQIDLYKQ